MKKNHIPEQGYPETDKDRTGDPIDDRQRVDRQLAPESAGHHHFSYVGAHIDEKAHGKNYDPFLDGMVKREYRGISQPEEYNTGVKGIDNESGRKDPGHISFTESGFSAIRLFAERDLFKENEINAHGDEKAAAA